MKTIAVHDGNFHADDVFSASILRLVFPDVKIIRTRDPIKLSNVDARIDVGGRYDPETNDFDHHQKGGAGERKEGIPYASAGLIWKHFGRKLVNSEDVFNYIDDKIIKYVDADDVGINTFSFDKVRPYTIADFIKGLNPKWPDETSELCDSYFHQAVSIIVSLLTREIKLAEGLINSRDLVRGKLIESNGEYLVLGDYVPWKKVVIEESNIKYVIFRNPLQENWCAVAVPVKLDSFRNRKDFPKEWGGLTDQDLQKVSKVKDAVFCHNNLFLAIAKSLEGAIKLVELALRH